MAKSCAVHPDRPSATMCHQCHRPVCKACTMVTPHGTFCSSACSIQNREFKESYQAGGGRPARGGLAMKLFLGVLLIVMTVVGIHLAAKRGIAPARAIDLLGRLLESVEAANPR